MKLTQAIYLVLAIIGFAAVLAIPLSLYGSGSSALPFWRMTASPGPLSKAHAFLRMNAAPATPRTKASRPSPA